MKFEDRQVAITKITQMKTEQVLKVLIFMAGIEAEAGTQKELEKKERR